METQFTDDQSKFIDWMLENNWYKANNRYECSGYGEKETEIQCDTLKEVYEMYLENTDFDNPHFEAYIIDKNTIKETCGGCPMIWDFETVEGDSGYIRLRHSCLSIVIDDEVVFDEYYPHFDGVMNNSDMIDFVTSNSKITFS
jgi:hypothetical protein